MGFSGIPPLNAGKFQRRGCSSVDRVLASEAKGRGFDPRQPHHKAVLHGFGQFGKLSINWLYSVFML